MAEKLSALRTEEYFEQRSRRADWVQTLRILEKAGEGNAPLAGDGFLPIGGRYVTGKEAMPNLSEDPGAQESKRVRSVGRRLSDALSI